MKKTILLFLTILGCFLLIGCGKYGEKDVVKDLSKKIEKAKGYHLTGVLEMINNEDTYLYDIDVSYEAEEKFRVSLKNKTNNHEQIILRNEEGVYVLTPSLNKSFKFQSEWPYNNSQSYLLQTLLKDITSDKDRIFKVNDKGYVITTKVNYSNNKDLIKQNIYLDKNLNITEVHVLNDKNQVQIKMKFNKIDMKATFDNKYFTLKENMETAVVDEQVKPVSKITDVIYPMYIPQNTHLTGQNKVTKEDGEVIMLTFGGEKPFTLIQETATKEKDLLTIPMNGEPVILSGTIGAMSDSSITWVNDGIEYYLISDVASEEELLTIAKSISVMPVGK